MTCPASELDAEIQKTEARLAELQAQRAALAVDPLLIEARALVEKWWPNEGALVGLLDDSMWMQRILAALRRGMELALAPRPNPVR